MNEHMKYISLVFSEDLHRNDIDAFKAVHNCTGVSAYNNTLNMYFRTLDRPALASLASVLQAAMCHTGSDVALQNTVLDSTVSTTRIYEALQIEVEI